jgi:hypothetical protein
MSKEIEELNLGSSHYMGNENLPRKGATFTWTEEMLAEVRSCADSILRFAQEHFYITVLDQGKEKIKLFEFQQKILQMLKDNRFSVILASRQMGKSTVVAIYALWTACFQDNKKIVIIANKEDTAIEQFERVKMAYEQLPNFLKPGVKSWRKDGIVFTNDSTITISATSSSAARGGSVNVLIVDEFAFIDKKILNELWRSAIPTISTSKKSKIIVISTPNGTQNKFYDLYNGALKGENGWAHTRVDWWERPERDEVWRQEQIKLLGSVEAFNIEFGNSFIEEAESVLDFDVIEGMRAKLQKPVIVLDDGDYKIWKRPEAGKLYTIGVDIGEGVGRNYSVIQVMDITDLTNIEQVAVYANNKLDPYHFTTKLVEIAKQWGNPPLAVERNNCGGGVVDALIQTHEYPNLVNYTHSSQIKYNSNHRSGILAHTNTKYHGIRNMRYWFNKLRVVTLRDLDTLQEFETFVKMPNDTWQRKSSETHDDRVMSLTWGLFVLFPEIVQKHFDVIDFDAQGLPKHISGFEDTSHLISKSALIQQQDNNNEDNAEEGLEINTNKDFYNLNIIRPKMTDRSFVDMEDIAWLLDY